MGVQEKYMSFMEVKINKRQIKETKNNIMDFLSGSMSNVSNRREFNKYIQMVERRKWVLRVKCDKAVKYFADRKGEKLTDSFSNAYIYNSKQAAEQTIKYWALSTAKGEAQDVDSTAYKLKQAYGIKQSKSPEGVNEPVITPIDISVILPNVKENADLFPYKEQVSESVIKVKDNEGEREVTSINFTERPPMDGDPKYRVFKRDEYPR